MAEVEYFDEFYAKFNDIVNSPFNLDETIEEPKLKKFSTTHFDTI